MMLFYLTKTQQILEILFKMKQKNPEKKFSKARLDLENR